MTYRKADVLIVIMGTNPFPNIVSAATRVRTDGYIFVFVQRILQENRIRNLKNF